MRMRLEDPQFSNVKLQILWAAFAVLEPDEALEFVGVIGGLLGAGRFPATRTKDRQADAIACLVEVSQILGRSPSMADYDQLRRERPELELVASGSIRTRLGAGWSDCLQRAQLAPAIGGDAPVQREGKFQQDELLAALRLCHEMLGEVPSTKSYSAWARRPDVRALPGRRPLNHQAFARAFDSFNLALKAAGIVGDGVVHNGRRDPAVWSYERDDLTTAIRLVAERLGRPPRMNEYIEMREQLLASAEVVAMPTASTITDRFRFWKVALEAAGLDPDNVSPSKKSGPNEPIYADQQMLAWMRRAYAAVGEPFTVEAYRQWRIRELSERGVGRRAIPGPWTISKRFGSWPAACERMVEDSLANDDDAEQAA